MPITTSGAWFSYAAGRVTKWRVSIANHTAERWFRRMIHISSFPAVTGYALLARRAGVQDFRRICR